MTAQQFVMTGICGGYTTFSAFSLQTLGLMQGNHLMAAGANIVLSVVLCLISVWLGHTAGTLVNPS
jgi:CrcB protein